MERRKSTRVEGLVLRPEERSANAASADDRARGPGARRAALWGDDPANTASLRFHLDKLGVTLEKVDSVGALLDAAPRSIFLVIDCAAGADALARCRAVVPRATRPVVICHPDRDFVEDLLTEAGGALVWIPPEWLGSRLRDRLALLVAPSEAPDSQLGNPLSPREKEV